MFGLEAWHIWLAAGILLITLEVFVSDFVLALLGAAAIAAAGAALGGLDFVWQLAVFVGASAVMLPTVRPLVKRWFYRGSSDTVSNVDALTGKTGEVVETIPGSHEPGRVRIGSEVWRAITPDDSVMEPGALVQVVRSESATLVVIPKPRPKAAS